MALYAKATQEGSHRLSKERFAIFASDLGITELNQIDLLFAAFNRGSAEGAVEFKDVVLGLSAFTRGTFLEQAKCTLARSHTHSHARAR